MVVSYKKLWKLLIDKDMMKKDLQSKAGISWATLQVCLDCGAKKILLPQTSAVDLGTVPADLMSSFNLIFYQSAEDAVFKALGVE